MDWRCQSFRTHPPRDDEEGCFRVVRYGTSILIFGSKKQVDFTLVHRRLLLFLEERGLGDSSRVWSYTFRPGVSVDYLGFKYLYTDRNAKGRFSTGRWNRFGRFVKPPRFQVILPPSTLSRCKEVVQDIFSRRHAPARVETLLRRYNLALERILAYFDISKTTHAQFQSVNYEGFVRIRNLLGRKFRSSPKLGTFLNSKFYANDTGNDLRIRHEGVEMKKVKDFNRPLQTFSEASPPTSYFKSNIYLDRDDSEGGSREERRSSPPTPVWIDDIFATKIKFKKPSKDVVGDDEDFFEGWGL